MFCLFHRKNTGVKNRLSRKKWQKSWRAWHDKGGHSDCWEIFVELTG